LKNHLMFTIRSSNMTPSPDMRPRQGAGVRFSTHHEKAKSGRGGITKDAKVKKETCAHLEKQHSCTSRIQKVEQRIDKLMFQN
jgi:hypothetical protein